MILAIGTLLLNLYAASLVIIRARVYRTTLYRPMLWNIWLSVLPILFLVVGGLIGFIARLLFEPAGIVILVLVGLAWLLLLPNATYLITELNQSHRRSDDVVPLWFDIVLVLSLAMSGVANTVVNVFVAHSIITVVAYGDVAGNYVQPGGIALVGVILLLMGVGVYLGRYPRFNSWDIRHPSAFVRKFRLHFADAANVWACVGMSLSYAIFLALMYAILAGPTIDALMRLESGM